MPFWWPKRKPTPPSKSDVREFIRHTFDVPIEFRLVEGVVATDLGPLPPVGTSDGDGSRVTSAGHSVNVGFGGLAFQSNFCPRPGDFVELRIPSVSPPFVARAKVAWCRPESGGYLIGASFLDASDAFRSRMVQQVCAIENYRKDVLEKEGRELDTQQASAEWIEKFAGRFPTTGNS